MKEDNITKKVKNKKMLLVIFVILITIIIVLFLIFLSRNYTKTYTLDKNNNSTVALVNKIPIQLKTLNLAMSDMVKSSSFDGVDTSSLEVQDKIRNIALDTIIDQEVIVQKAREQKIEIPKSKIESEFNLVKFQYENDNAFISKLNSIGMTEDDLRNDIERQLLITAFQDKIYDESKDIVNDSDIRIFYDALKQKYIEQDKVAPPIESIREKIIQKILDRRHQLFMEKVAKMLREKAKIEKLI